MQDKFKYRIFDKDDKKIHDVIFINYENNSIEWLNEQDKKRAAFIGEVPTMQCTGLQDKSGKLLFEWDIVTDGRHNMLVYYDKETCSFALQKRTQYTQKRFGKDGFEQVSLRNLSEDSFKNHQLKIIGNIYKNPELLEVNK